MRDCIRSCVAIRDMCDSQDISFYLGQYYKSSGEVVIEWVRSFHDMNGVVLYDSSGHCSSWLRERLHPDDNDGAIFEWCDILKNKKYIRRYRLRLLDGKFSWFSENINTYYDDDVCRRFIGYIVKEHVSPISIADEHYFQTSCQNYDNIHLCKSCGNKLMNCDDNNNFEQILRQERESSAIKSLFISMISHEIRTPLAVILGAADLLGNNQVELSRSECVDYLQSIKKSVKRITRTMDDVLIFTKVQNRQLRFCPAKSDVVLLMHDMIVDAEELHDGRKILLKISRGFPRSLAVDTTLIYHIVSNLVSNAIKYSPAASLVEVDLKYHDDQLDILVKDKGIGIPESEIGDVFRLFNRCSNVGNNTGIGMGLFIVKHCVMLHGGTIAVNSRQNEGTIFKVSLPVKI